jgi:hypothetical protein
MMSTRQEKIEERKAAQQAFIAQRRKMQLAIFQTNFNVGIQLYESNKDKMSPEEIRLVEIEIQKNLELLEKLKSEANTGTQA